MNSSLPPNSDFISDIYGINVNLCNIHCILDLHCHPIGREGGIDKKARRKLIIASVLCVLFMLMEIVGESVSCP